MTKIKDYAKTIIEQASPGLMIDNYVRDVFNKTGQSEIIGGTYLLKAPNGKPMFWIVGNVRGGKSKSAFATLEYGKIAGTPEFYLDWNILNTKKAIIRGRIEVLSTDEVKRIFKDLGITANKIPDTAGLNAKALPAYIVIK